MEHKGHTLARMTLLGALGLLALAAFFGVGGFFAAGSALAQDEVAADTDTVIIMPVDEEAKAAVQNEEAAVPAEEEEEKIEEADQDEGASGKTAQFMAAIKKNWDRGIDRMPSLFFTYWQHQSIIDAKNSHGKARPPTEAELEALQKGEELKLDPGRRYVSLGGIVYKGENDWTIWLNGERVTPDALPEEALDLRVYKDYIEVKWLDEYTNSVYPLRLRAHQRFNLDMRIFLPG